MLNKFDQRLIDFFTMICWWTEVKWEKNNLCWAYHTNIIAHISWFFFFTFALIQVMKTGSQLWVFFFSIFVAISGFTLCLKVIFQRKTIDHYFLVIFPQGSPNPCRFLKEKISDRKGWVYSALLVYIAYLIQDVSKYAEYESMWIFSFYTTLIFSFFFEYLMACDSMPPEEKAKRKARVEEWNGNLQPIRISGN
ncbi:hypothetical protein K9M47_02520 [Candidatus Gracilibacteria bacterium]|nr:hypothetical protein [Candidatus Gracilibacteria bacterium]